MTIFVDFSGFEFFEPKLPKNGRFSWISVVLDILTPIGLEMSDFDGFCFFHDLQSKLTKNDHFLRFLWILDF